MSESPTAPVPAGVVEAFDDAQRKTITIAREVAGQLRPGVTPTAIERALEQAAPAQGFTGWFHRPHVRFGAPAHHRHGARRPLQRGDVVELDLAPANAQAFGDFSVAFIFSSPDEPAIVSDARALCRATAGFASRWKCTGELFVYAQAWATNHGARLSDQHSVGHICLPAQGIPAVVWPQAARAAILLRRHQIQWFNPRRMAGIYAIQPRLTRKQRGCGFEEMVLVNGDTRRVLGRDALDQVGTL